MASKGAAQRAAARKQRDKWKAKRWYTLRAPRQPWQFKVIGETLGESSDHIIGRIYELPQNEVDGDFSKMHIKLRFRVTSTVGEDAMTEYIGHTFQNDFVRRQIRRYRGKVDDTIDCVTVDGYYVRVKPLIITGGRVKSSQKSEMRRLMKDIILQFAARSTWVEMQSAMMSDELERMVTAVVRDIQPPRAVMIRKSQLIQSGVELEDGMTLEEIVQEEARAAAELKLKKEAALDAAEAGEDEVDDDADDDESADGESADEDTSDEAEEPATEEATEAEEAPDEAAADEDLSALTVPELKERLKAAGLKVGGKKADLIARLSE
jgi:small subunit ribosomal protein S3Ae